MLVENQETVDAYSEGGLIAALRAIAMMRAEDRRTAEYGPGGGNPDAKATDHIEWVAADRIEELECRSQLKTEIKNRMRHFYGQTDGTYAWPNSAEGDLLKLVYTYLTVDQKP